MKIFNLILLLSLFLTPAFSQVPEKVNYQAVIRDSDNKPVTDQEITMEITLLQGSPTEGKSVYTETHKVNTSTDGVIAILIGDGETPEGQFSGIDWSSGPFFLSTETTINGEQELISGTTQLLSVPYALHAKTADTVREQQELPTIVANNNSVDNQLKDLDEPTDPSDATTKAYVDALQEKIDELTIKAEGVTDYDGNRYEVVEVGDNLWMAEDLVTTTYNDGTEIPEFSFDNGDDKEEWLNLTTGAYTKYYADEIEREEYFAEDGVLYNWYAVETEKLCPEGWEVPSDEDWKDLEISIGMSEEDADAFGERSLEEDIIAGYYRFVRYFDIKNNGLMVDGVFDGDLDGSLYDKGEAQYWWTSSIQPLFDMPYARIVNRPYINRNAYSRKNGFSVRCIKSSE